MNRDYENDDDLYSKVTRRMWADGDFASLSTAPPNGQTLWFRLLTGLELTVIPGLFPAWDAGLARALRWPIDGFLRAWTEIAEKGMAEADWDAGLVWVPNAIKHNKPANPNIVKGWRRAWRQLPECQLKQKAFLEIRAVLQTIGAKWVEAFDEACGEPSSKRLPEPSGTGSPNQDQDQDQDQQQRADRARAPEAADSGDAPRRPPPPVARTDLRRFEESLSGRPHPQDLAVLDNWKRRFSKSGVTFDSKRMACLGDRRAEDMTTQDAEDALAGAAADPWCESTGFKISVIFGDRESYEAFRDAGRAIRAGKPPPARRARAGQEQRQPNTGAYSATSHARRL